MSDKQISIDDKAAGLVCYFWDGRTGAGGAYVGEYLHGDGITETPMYATREALARARTLVLADEGLDAIIEELGLPEGERPLPLESRSMFIIERIREERAAASSSAIAVELAAAVRTSTDAVDVRVVEPTADPPEWLARYAELAEDMGVGVLAEGSYTQTANQWLGDGSFTQPLVAEQAKLACERRDYLAALGAATVLAEMRPSLGDPLKVALLALAMRACKDDEPVGHPAGFNACTKVRSDGVVELTVSEGARIVEVLDDEQDFEGF